MASHKKFMAAMTKFTRFLPTDPKKTYRNDSRTLIYQLSPIPTSYTDEQYNWSYNELYPSLSIPNDFNTLKKNVDDEILIRLATFFYQVCTDDFTENEKVKLKIDDITQFMKDYSVVKKKINKVTTDFANVQIKMKSDKTLLKSQIKTLQEKSLHDKKILLNLYKTHFNTENKAGVTTYPPSDAPTGYTTEVPAGASYESPTPVSSSSPTIVPRNKDHLYDLLPIKKSYDNEEYIKLYNTLFNSSSNISNHKIVSENDKQEVDGALLKVLATWFYEFFTGKKMVEKDNNKIVMIISSMTNDTSMKDNINNAFIKEKEFRDKLESSNENDFKEYRKTLTEIANNKRSLWGTIFPTNANEGGGKRRNTRRHKKKANQTHRKKRRRNSRKKHNTRRKYKL